MILRLYNKHEHYGPHLNVHVKLIFCSHNCLKLSILRYTDNGPLTHNMRVILLNLTKHNLSFSTECLRWTSIRTKAPLGHPTQEPYARERESEGEVWGSVGEGGRVFKGRHCAGGTRLLRRRHTYLYRKCRRERACAKSKKTFAKIQFLTCWSARKDKLWINFTCW